eukprot:6413389-Amphidinium_carterae.1
MEHVTPSARTLSHGDVLPGADCSGKRKLVSAQTTNGAGRGGSSTSGGMRQYNGYCRPKAPSLRYNSP